MVNVVDDIAICFSSEVWSHCSRWFNSTSNQFQRRISRSNSSSSPTSSTQRSASEIRQIRSDSDLSTFIFVWESSFVNNGRDLDFPQNRVEGTFCECHVKFKKNTNFGVLVICKQQQSTYLVASLCRDPKPQVGPIDWRAATDDSEAGTPRCTRVSSAYECATSPFLLMTSNSSAVYSRKKRGPGTEPCGTPSVQMKSCWVYWKLLVSYCNCI